MTVRPVLAPFRSFPRPAPAALRTWPGILLVALFCFGWMVVRPAAAQDDEEVPVVTKAAAIQNARIVVAPGRVIERGTVVMRNGLITAVGPNVTIPYDAEVINGDSLVVYAGFVDGLSHVGIASSGERGGSEGVDASRPPDDLAGIQPQRSARDLLDPSDASVESLRNVGFTAAHVVPRGRMLPGSGSIVLLAGDEGREMVLRPDVSLFLQMKGASGVYPATPMGVMAKIRQLAREAERRRRIERLYAENPAGLERPAFDPVHEAFYPILSREKPVYVLADGDDNALTVHRTLQLQNELGFSLALAGLSQGFAVVDQLQEARVPLFLTLDLPEPPEEDTVAVDTTTAMTPEDPASFFVSDLRTHSWEDVAAETENLRARQSIEREKYYGTAAAFHEAGLRFGVTTAGVDTDDIRPNIKRMIDAGLPEDAALAALTIDGARLLGIDRSLGTVEKGKLANLVVTRGSYFDPQNPVEYVYVEGRQFEMADKREIEPDALAGEWNVTVTTDEGLRRGTLTLRIRRGKLEGEIEGERMSAPAELEDVRLRGNRLSFAFETAEYGRLSVSATVDRSSLSGTLRLPDGEALPISGDKPE